MKGLNDNLVLRELSEDEKKKWKKEMRSAFRSSAKDLRKEGVSLMDNETEEGLKNEINRVVARYKLISIVYNTSTAFYWLLSNDYFVPDTDNNGRTSIAELAGLVSPAGSGHAVTLESDDRELSSLYSIKMQISPPLLINSIYRLVEEGWLTEGEFFNILNYMDDISNDDLWYMTSAVTAAFDQRYAEALHLAIPRLENLLYQILLSHDEDVDALRDVGSTSRTLGSLLDLSEKYIGSRFYQYLRYMYNEPAGKPFGGNLRNRVTHGSIPLHADNPYHAFLIIVDFLRTGVRAHDNKFRALYGYPTRFDTLSVIGNNSSG